MKKILCACLLLLTLAGCSRPNDFQMNLYQGFGAGQKLLHINGSTEAKRQRMEAFLSATQDAQPLDKDISLFAYYPDYLLEITREGVTSRAVIDINGNYVDFYYPDETQLYRSRMTASEFYLLVNQRTN